MRKRFVILGSTLLVLLSVACCQLPELAAVAILHPFKRPVTADLPKGCEEISIGGEGVTLQGWRAAAIGPRRGTVIYLHGMADNRVSGRGVIE